MTSPTPSPPPLASATRSGLVSRVAQAFAGLKHFVDGLAVEAGQRIRLAGTGATSGLRFISGRVEVEPGLHVAGPTSVGGVLVVQGLPLASFPSAADSPGAILFDTGGKGLHVSTGVAWMEVASAAVVADKASQAALAEHIAATTAHGVTGAVVGTGGAQTLSNKTHSGTFAVKDVATGVNAIVIPLGSRLSLTPDGDRYFYSANARIYCNTIFESATVLGGTGQPMEGVSLGVISSDWQVQRDGRMLRRTADVATPGNGTANGFRGRCSIASGASSVTITNSYVKATSNVRAWIQQATADGTLTAVVRTNVIAGSFTVYGNTTATSAVVIAWELSD